MKKVLFFSIIASLFISMNIIAAPEASPEVSTNREYSKILKGSVYDKATKETLAGAVVTANGQKVYTDLDGNFVLTNLCNGNCKIKINYISYVEQTIDVNMDKSQELEIKLQSR